MRPIRHAVSGALALCALLSATACGSNGKPRDPPPTQDRIVEAAKRQLVPIELTLTEVPALPPAPAPEVSFGDQGCMRITGCYSSKQLEAMLTQALAGYLGAADNLRAIRRAGAEATKPAP